MIRGSPGVRSGVALTENTLHRGRVWGRKASPPGTLTEREGKGREAGDGSLLLTGRLLQKYLV